MKGIYARISADDEDSGLGVQRQVKDCRTIAELRGWEAQEYVDNDLSAYDRRVQRPEFEHLVSDLSAGVIDGIIVYNLDRLARQLRDLERVIDLYDDTAGLTFATVDGDVNLATDDGLTMARVMVTFANKASRDTGRRTKRKHLELAERGEPVGRRMFGWQDDKRTLDPQEAAIARTLVGDLLAGGGVREAVRRLNDEGVTTTTGGPWSHQTLRNYLRNPRLVGLRTRHGEVMLNDAGEPVRGTWEPLLDRETFDRVQALLNGRMVDGRQARRGARKYLLTGLLRCGICNGLMFGSKAREPGRFNYVCNMSSSQEDARHTLAASGTEVDRIIDALTFSYMSKEGLERDTPSETWSQEARLSEVGDQIQELMSAYDAGDMPGRLVFPRVQALEAELLELQSDRARWLVMVAGPVVRRVTEKSWKAMTPDEKRLQMDRVWSAIYVRPAKRRGGGGFDATRLDPVPRESRPAQLSVVR